VTTTFGRWSQDPEPRRIVVVGAAEQASIAHEYFTHDSPHQVVAFSVESEYLNSDSFEGLPLVAFESLSEAYPPSEHSAFVAISSNRLNRVRRRLYLGIKERGYDCVSYVSSHAFVGIGSSVGENTFVFENNVIQRGVSIGDDVILWSGNHLGHHCAVEDHVFFASHVVIAGSARIGAGAYMGANSFVHEFVSVGADCIVGAGAVVLADTEDRGVYVGSPARATGRDSLEAFGALDEP
jgi:sugar O-acyltransferase (sialic acid O-acetyltransferase NeuD family)